MWGNIGKITLPGVLGINHWIVVAVLLIAFCSLFYGFEKKGFNFYFWQYGRNRIMRWKQFLTPVASMDTEEAKAYMAEHEEGTFTLLDVRQPGEYENSRIPGAKLIPLPELADRLGELDPDKPVIPY